MAKGGIYIPQNRKVWPHEMHSATVLSDAGFGVEFLKETKIKNADILLDGVKYELKAPESFNSNTMDHMIRRAVKQSPNLVIDMCRMKKVNSIKVINFLENYVMEHKSVKKMLLIDKKGRVVDIFSLIS